jgi:hypothetical protein
LARQDKATGTRACELHEPSYADREKDGRAESDFLAETWARILGEAHAAKI